MNFQFIVLIPQSLSYYTVLKHDRHLRTRGKCRKHEPQASGFYFSRVFWMSGKFYHSVIHGLGFFICFTIDFIRHEQKQQSTQIDKLTQFNTTKLLLYMSGLQNFLLLRRELDPSQISSKKMFFAIYNKTITRGNATKNNKTRFSMFYTLIQGSIYTINSDKTWVIDQSERTQRSYLYYSVYYNHNQKIKCGSVYS